MPPIDGFEWLAAAFQEAGIADSGMGGPVPLSWAELGAYNRAVCGVYNSWTLCIMREMSQAYVSWYNKGGRQKDIADDVPYIERNEETLKAAGHAIIRSRDKSEQLRREAQNG